MSCMAKFLFHFTGVAIRCSEKKQLFNTWAKINEATENVMIMNEDNHTKPVLSFSTRPANVPSSSNTAAEVYSTCRVPLQLIIHNFQGGARVAGAVLSVSHLLTSGGAGVVTPLGLARDWWLLPGPGHVTSLPQLTFNSEDSYSSSSPSLYWTLNEGYPKVTADFIITEKAPTRAFSWLKAVALW